MPDQSPRVEQYQGPVEFLHEDFSGGLDAWMKRTSMIPNTAFICENAYPLRRVFDRNLYSALCTRPGLVELLDNPAGAGPGSLRNLTYVVTLTGGASVQWIFASVGDNIYATQWPAPLGWALVATIAGHTEMRAISIAGLGVFAVYGPGGVGGMFTWDGAAWAAIAGAPQARFIARRENRVFVAGQDAQPTRVNYSDDLSPTTGYSLNLLNNVGSDRGWPITGLLDYQGSLLIFTGNAVWQLAGAAEDDFRLFPITNSIGCVAPNTLCTDGERIFFLANRGFIRWDTQGEPVYLSELIWPYLRTDWNPNYIANAVAAYHDWGLYACYQNTAGAVGVNNRGIICELRKGGWFPVSSGNWNFASILSVENGLYLLAGDNTTGKLWQVRESSTDGANGISFQWRSLWNHFGQPTQPKLLNNIDILAEVDSAGTVPVTLRIYRDFSNTGTDLTATPDIGLRATGTGARMSPATNDQNRTIVLFRAKPKANFRYFKTLSWEIVRASEKTPTIVHAVKVYATMKPVLN